MKRRVVRHVLSFLAAGVSGAGLCFVSPLMLSAQVLNTASADVHVPTVSREAVLARTISVRVTRVPLKVALSQVAASADVRIQYKEAAVASYAEPVTLHVSNMTLGAVLDHLLAGTALQPMVSGADLITLKPATDVPPPPTNGVIVGRIINGKTKQPVVGATVLIDGATKGVVTGEDGTFRMTVPPGAHSLATRMVGFGRQTQQVTVADGATATVDFVLEPTASVLDEVVVTGSVVATERKAIANPITVITAADIEKRGITRIEQLFRGEVPGVVALERGVETYNVIGQYQSSSIMARGPSDIYGSSNGLKVFIDGVEFINSDALGLLDPKSIERIEIITGPQAATVYGSGAAGGVMQVFTKKGSGQTSTQLTLSAKYGMLESNMASGRAPTHNDAVSVVGGDGPPFSYSGNLSYVYTGQWSPKLFARQVGGSLGIVRVQGPVTINASGTATLSTNGFGNTCVFCGAFGRDMIEDGELYVTWAARSLLTIKNSYSSNTVGVTVDHRIAPWWQQQATVGRSQSVMKIIPGTEAAYMYPGDSMHLYANGPSLRNTLAYNTTLTSPHVGPLTATLTLGMTGSFQNETYTYGDLADRNASNVVVGGVYQSFDRHWGGFGQMRVGVFDQLFLTAGVRGERNPLYGDAHVVDWTPTVGAAYTIELGELTLKALTSYGRATKAPPPGAKADDYYYNASYNPSKILTQRANPDLRPSYSRGPQGGVELYWGNVATLTVNHYSQRLYDLIQSVTIDSMEVFDAGTGLLNGWWSISQYVNVSEVRSKGWESTGSVNLGPVALRGTYSWNDSRVTKAPAGYEYYLRQGLTPRVPTHTGSIGATYALGGTSIALVSNWIGQRTGVNAAIERLNYLRSYQRMPMYYVRARGAGLDGVGPGYFKTDLGVSQRVTSALTATLNVTNLGNTFISDGYATSPALGRTTELGFSFRFP